MTPFHETATEVVYVAFQSASLGGARVFRMRYTGTTWAFTLVANLSGEPDWIGDHLTASAMQLGDVRDLFLSGDLLYLADGDTHRVVAVNVGTSSMTVAGLAIAPGEARMVAGGGQGEAGFNGDAVPPDVAFLNQPTGVVSSGTSVFLVDRGNSRIRRFQR